MNNKPAKAFAALVISVAMAFGACAEGNPRDTTTQAPSATDAPTRPAESMVGVAQFKFAPARLEIAVGATVRWDNSDEILHTATSGVPGAVTGAFDGQMSGAGTGFEFTFETPGTYAYFCSRHVFMTGEVVVT